jgi:hypothetical protein
VLRKDSVRLTRRFDRIERGLHVHAAERRRSDAAATFGPTSVGPGQAGPAQAGPGQAGPAGAHPAAAGHPVAAGHPASASILFPAPRPSAPTSAT